MGREARKKAKRERDCTLGKEGARQRQREREREREIDR